MKVNSVLGELSREELGITTPHEHIFIDISAFFEESTQFDSVALSKKISEAVDATGKIALIIGSSHGLSDKVKENCKLKLSISKLTFPHQLMRAMLFEILYRSFTIIAGKKYHK